MNYKVTQDMLFFPYSADIHLGRIPIVTILISLLCIGIYYKQSGSGIELAEFADDYCAQSWGRNYNIAMSKLSDNNHQQVCSYIMVEAQLSKDVPAFFKEIAEQSAPFDSLDRDDGKKFIVEQLTIRFEDYQSKAPAYKTADLWYYPDSFNVGRMITAAFAHGSWGHLAGNLFFFFAFAACIEVIVGNILFPLIIIGLAMGTHTFYSLATMANAEALPTVGLSGVVMGMIGMCVYFLPKVNIKCFFWLLFYVRIFAIPAWILASWYIGWDIYSLYHDDGSSNVNFVAHVSGAALGYLAGFLFFRKRKQEILALNLS
jgi:membrane associated rhomboid family serine protease